MKSTTPLMGTLVKIHYRGHRCFHSHALHIADDGMFLYAPTLTIPANTNVVLQFAHEGKNYRVPAMVADNDPDGIGVIFHTSQPGLARTPQGTASPSIQAESRLLPVA